MDNNINTPNTNNNYEVQSNVPNINNNFNQSSNNYGYVSNVPNKSSNNNNILTIVICLVVIGVFVGGGFLFVKTIFDSGNKVLEDIEGNAFKDKEEETELYNFSKYKNYRFVMDISVVADEIELKTSSTGVSDVKNKTDYMQTVATSGGYTITSYSYSDYASGYTYTSSDKKSWKSDSTSGTESINLKDLIDKINNNTDVEVIGKDHYKVKIDYDNGDVIYDNVYADVEVINGYIYSLKYDFTSIVDSEDISKFTIEIKISDVNVAGSVTIPDDVKKGTNSI